MSSPPPPSGDEAVGGAASPAAVEAAGTTSEPLECRICRGADSPLYRPCKCAGSIGHVHTECLLEWLEHSGRGES